MTETSPLVRLLRTPCPGRIARAVGETVNGFARIGDAGYLVRCDTCGHSYHVAAGVLHRREGMAATRPAHGSRGDVAHGAAERAW